MAMPTIGRRDRRARRDGLHRARSRTNADDAPLGQARWPAVITTTPNAARTLPRERQPEVVKEAAQDALDRGRQAAQHGGSLPDVAVASTLGHRAPILVPWNRDASHDSRAGIPGRAASPWNTPSILVVAPCDPGAALRDPCKTSRFQGAGRPPRQWRCVGRRGGVAAGGARAGSSPRGPVSFLLRRTRTRGGKTITTIAAHAA